MWGDHDVRNLYLGQPSHEDSRWGDDSIRIDDRIDYVCVGEPLQKDLLRGGAHYIRILLHMESLCGVAII